MFDKAFFEHDLPERARAFSGEHGGLGVRVEIVTRTGERVDALEVDAAKDGISVITREEHLVVVPYAQISHVDVSPLRDHRIQSFALPDA
jgi:hypothetical protein